MSGGILSKEALQNLRCHLCNKYLTIGPIKSISVEGDVNQCGRCKDIPSQYNINNFCYEKIAPFLQFPCTFDGCHTIIHWKEVEEHEKTCNYATFQCPQLFCNTIVGMENLSHHVYNHVYFVGNIDNFNLQDNQSHVFFVMKDSQIYFIFICHDGTFLYVGVYASQKLVSEQTHFIVSFSSPNAPSLKSLEYKAMILKYDDNHCFKCMRGYCNLKYHKYSNHYSKAKKNLRRVVLQIDFGALKKILNNPDKIECSLTIEEPELKVTKVGDDDRSSTIVDNPIDDVSTKDVKEKLAIECVHVNEAVDLMQVKMAISNIESLDCKECKKMSPNSVVDCDALFLCLKCGKLSCGRRWNEHALKHWESDSHAICVNTLHWSIWCYECDVDIDVTCSKELQETVEYLKNQVEMIRNENVNEICKQSGDGYQINECVHINLAVDFEQVVTAINNTGLLSDCKECKEMSLCNGDDGSLWLCLKCGKQSCGRNSNRHALRHWEELQDSHAVCINSLRWDVWCYACHVYIDIKCNKTLQRTVKHLKMFSQRQ